MAKLNIQKQGFPSVSEAYNNLLGVKNDNQYVSISLSLLDEIDNQPFPINEEKIEQIADSIENVGIIEPLIVVKDGERYKILSGRHRYRACQKLGKKEIPCYIKDVSEDVARYILIATNTDRNNEYSPMVYARAYAEQLELMKKMGKKSTVSAIAEQNGLSRKQIFRYIRLTNLVKELQEWVDNKIIIIETAVELSFLSKEKQLALYTHIVSLGIADTVISRHLKFEVAKKVHRTADMISNDEFAENIDKIIFGNYSIEQTVESVPEAEPQEVISETPPELTEKTMEKSKYTSIPKKKSSVVEQKEQVGLEVQIKETSDNTQNEEITESAITEVESDISDEPKDDDWAKIIKGYMLIALHDYGMDCNKSSIDELYERVNQSAALEVYNKLYE